MTTMTDTQAEAVLQAVLNLATTLRDEGPQAVDRAAFDTFMAAGGDCTAALIVACALINVDAPVDAWWQKWDWDKAHVLYNQTTTGAA